MLIQLYLGTGILVETIVVVDILVGFFSQLSRLCCWCDYSVLFLYIKCFGFSLLRPKFLLSCGWIDVAWSVDCGIVVISLFCGSFLAEIFIRKKITSTGALWESRVRYISFFTSVLWTFAKSNATHTSTSRKYKKTITTHQHLPTQW